MLNISHSLLNPQEMENSNKTGIRQYKKSALPRLRWTPELHEHFLEAVEHLGGKHKATPKRIVQMMGVRGLQMSHVKSHLQMYRSMKKRSTMNLVVPSKLHGEETPDVAAWSPSRKVAKDQHELPKKKKEPGSSITCKGRIQILQHDKTTFNYQVPQGSTSCNMSKESESEIFDFLQTVADCGQEKSLWSSDDQLVSQSSASSNCFDILLQSSKDSHVNLDLSISSCY